MNAAAAAAEPVHGEDRDGTPVLLRLLRAASPGCEALAFWCPACSSFHTVDVALPTTPLEHRAPDVLTLSNDVYAPTLDKPVVTKKGPCVCVVRLREGWLVYDSTSTHAFAGVFLPLELPAIACATCAPTPSPSSS